MLNAKKLKLSDICDISSGGTPKRSVPDYWNDGDIPWVKIGDISDKHITETSEFITEEGLKNSSAKWLEPGTILYSIFASIGAVGILDISATTNQAIAGLKITSDFIDTDYLYHWLKSQEAISKHAGRGVAQNNINLTILKNMELPVPSLLIQKDIARKFEAILARIDICKHQLSKLDDLVKSRFVEMFGDPYENSPWTISKVKDIAEITVGVVVKPAQYYVDELDGVKAFRSLNIAPMRIKDDSWVYFSEYGNEKNSKSKLSAGDVLIVRSGYPGTACVVTEEYEGCNAIDVIIARVNRSILLPEFFASFMNSPYGQRQIKNGTGGSAQKHFNVGTCKMLDIILPPIELQMEHLSFIQHVDKLKTAAQQQIDKLQELYDSLAQEYFGS